MCSVGLSFALTSLCFREGLFLYAITGVSWKMSRSVLFLRINFQCFLMMSLSLLASSQNGVTKANFLWFSLGCTKILVGFTFAYGIYCGWGWQSSK